MEDIGTQIRTERKRRKMTADDVGRLVGRDRQSIYLYEGGKAEPSGEVMLKLVEHGFVKVPKAAKGAA